MKETSFIEQNKAKWKRFQQLAANDDADPEEISDLYSDITDDLSYAQTFYGKRTVRVYLNQLAQGIHNLVHKQKSEGLKKIFNVWRISIPLEIYRARKNLLFALIVALFWTALGAVSTLNNPDFLRNIVGSYYVDQTIENINNGEPLNVYESASQLAMFFEITLNNIKVAFLCFIFGITLTIGTHILLMSNSVMLGSFQAFFQTKGVLLTSFLGIWIHGAFEISSIVIAAGAGFTMGNGILFPGSYSRLQSLQIAAKSGLKIMMSLIVFLTIAGFLESYVTHNYNILPEWSKWGIILFSFSIIIFYYVIYPQVVARKYPELVHEQDFAVKNYTNVFNLNRIRTFGQVFSDSFSFYRVHFGKIFWSNIVLSGPIIIALLLFQDSIRYGDLTAQHTYDWAVQLNVIMGTDLKYNSDWIAVLGWTIVATQLINTTCYHFRHQEEPFKLGKVAGFNYRKLPQTWAMCFLVFCCLFLVPWYWCFLLLFVVPLFLQLSVSAPLGEEGFWTNFGQGFSFSTKSYGTMLTTLGLFSVMIFLFAQPIAFVFSFHLEPFTDGPMMPDLLDILAKFVSNVSRYYTHDFVFPGNVTRQIVYILFIFITMPLFITMIGFCYYSSREKETSYGLKEEFTKFGKRKRNQETAVDFE